MTAQNHALQVRVVACHLGDAQAQLEPGSPPRDPAHLVSEALLGQRLTVDGRRQSDDRIGVEMIDVGRFQQPVHCGVDARCSAACPKAAVVEERLHLILVFLPPIDGAECSQPIHPESGKSIGTKSSEIATRSFDPHDLDLVTRCRVNRHRLGRRVATAVVGVATVGAQSVGARDQLLDNWWRV